MSKKPRKLKSVADDNARRPERVPVWQAAALAGLLAAVTLGVFWQAVNFDFVNLDDNVYVYKNHVVLRGLTADGVRYAFGFHALNWHPLTWLSLMADSQLSGWLYARGIALGNEKAGVFHAVNILLHLANTLLLFFLLTGLTGKPWRSAFAASLFAVHPCHVESVAWVTERKDVLSTLFWLLSIAAYALWVRKPGLGRYLCLVLTFALGLMSKPMLVTLPLTLLLLDFWPLGRLRPGPAARSEPGKARTLCALLIEKLPLFAMAAASSVVTLFAQRRGVVPFDLLPLGVRAANAAVSGIHYIGKLFWPQNLACLYPHPGNEIPTWMVPASAAGLAAVTAFALGAARRLPYLVFGWLWYLVTLLPVCGLVQVGRQQMADRYTYVPFIGLFVIIAWVPSEFVGRMVPRIRKTLTTVLAAAAIAAVGVLCLLSFRQTALWSDSITLMRHAARATKDNFVAYNNLAQALSETGDIEGAFDAAIKAVDIHPNYVDALYNLGTLYAIVQQFDKAEEAFRKVLELKPNHSNACNNLGRVAVAQNRLDDAIELFRAAVRMDPANEDARRNLELALSEKELLTEDAAGGY